MLGLLMLLHQASSNRHHGPQPGLTTHYSALNAAVGRFGVRSVQSHLVQVKTVIVLSGRSAGLRASAKGKGGHSPTRPSLGRPSSMGLLDCGDTPFRLCWYFNFAK
jgi:hypothetical protein